MRWCEVNDSEETVDVNYFNHTQITRVLATRQYKAIENSANECNATLTVMVNQKSQNARVRVESDYKIYAQARESAGGKVPQKK